MNKTIVQGMFDREARKIRAQVVPNVSRETLQNLLLKNIKVRLRRLYRQRGRL